MFKQPRVPDYKGSEPIGPALRRLTLFLRGFCAAVWEANNERKQEIKELRERFDKLTGGE